MFLCLYDNNLIWKSKAPEGVRLQLEFYSLSGVLLQAKKMVKKLLDDHDDLLNQILDPNDKGLVEQFVQAGGAEAIKTSATKFVNPNWTCKDLFQRSYVPPVFLFTIILRLFHILVIVFQKMLIACTTCADHLLKSVS